MSLFSWRKRNPPPPPDLARLFGRLMTRAEEPKPSRRPSRSSASVAEASFASATLRDAEAFRLPDEAEPASLLVARLGVEAPSLSLLCPPSMRELAIEALRLLCLLARAKGGGSVEAPMHAFLSLQPASGGVIEALLSRVGPASSYELGPYRLLVEASAQRAIEARLLEGGLEEALAFSRAEVLALQDSALSASLRIERPADIVASRLFMPPRFQVGGFEAGVFWDSLGIEAGQDETMGTELWFSASAGRAGSQILFSCPAPREAREAYAARILPILEAGWRRAAALLSSGGTGAVLALSPLAAAPAARRLSGWLRFEGELRLGGGGFRLCAHLPPAFLRLLGAASGASAEGLLGNETVHAFLAANEALLARWRTSYPASFLGPRKLAGSSSVPKLPTIASILGFLGPQEGALVLQNCLLPSLGPKELPRLFFRRVEGRDRARLIPLEPFSEARIQALLSPLAREEWENELASGFGDRAWGAEEALTANEAAARLLYSSLAAGRLELSPASAALLEVELGQRIAAEGRAELAALAAAGLPFGILDDLGRGELIRLLGPFSNRELALGILGDETRLPLVKKCMSASRLREFGEELEIVAKRFGRGELSAAELVAGKRELRKGLELRLKRLAEEKQADRGSAAAAPRPRN